MANVLSQELPGSISRRSEADRLIEKRPFSVAHNLKSLWHIEAIEVARRTINPNTAINDPDFEAVRPDLQILSTSEHSRLLKWLLSWKPLSSQLVESLPEWRSSPSNPILTVLSRACRVGLFDVDANSKYWHQTAFGASFATAWQHGTPLDMFRIYWKQKMASQIRHTVRWGWKALQEPSCRTVLNYVAANPIGVTHAQILKINGHFSLRGVAAATAIGAAWYTGMRWEPTMLGAYLVFSPESELNRPLARGR